jgi:hypothetical protein
MPRGPRPGRLPQVPGASDRATWWRQFPRLWRRFSHLRNTCSVAIPIDTSQPLLRPSQLDALVRAVANADDHDEHDWIEWKSNLDLSSSEGKWHIVKQILGFSNRTVSTAARHAAGHAYLLAGVEPGALTGVASVDHADLTSSIDRYVGAARWTPEYVTVDGKSVLVVIIDPPKPGDPPFSLRKGYDKHQAGTVFVRVPGKSEQASPAQLDALVQRAKATRETLDVVVRADPATIEVGPIDDEHRLAEILDAERAVLMAAGRSKRPAPRAPRRPGWPGALGATMPEFRPLTAISAFTQIEKPDERTEVQYAEEVEKYLEGLRSILKTRYLHRRFHHAGGALHFVIDNPTDRNFRNLRVVVHVAGDVRSWPESLVDDLYLPEFPQRPRPMGTPTKVSNPYESLLNSSLRSAPYVPPVSFYSGPGFSINDTGSVTIDFDPVDLRPRTPETLPRVPLVVHEQIGTDLQITWEATAENVDGLRSGVVTSTVVEGTIVFENVPDKS